MCANPVHPSLRCLCFRGTRILKLKRKHKYRITQKLLFCGNHLFHHLYTCMQNNQAPSILGRILSKSKMKMWPNTNLPMIEMRKRKYPKNSNESVRFSFDSFFFLPSNVNRMWQFTQIYSFLTKMFFTKG